MEMCRSDPRFEAAINIDGILFGEATRKGMSKPFMLITSHNPQPKPAPLESLPENVRRQSAFLGQNWQDMRRCLAESRGCSVGIPGAWHMNFCDSALYTPVKRLTHAGPIRPEHALEIINACVLSFFQIHLNGKDEADLAALSNRYPGVVFTRFSSDEPR